MEPLLAYKGIGVVVGEICVCFHKSRCTSSNGATSLRKESWNLSWR